MTGGMVQLVCMVKKDIEIQPGYSNLGLLNSDQMLLPTE